MKGSVIRKTRKEGVLVVFQEQKYELGRKGNNLGHRIS